MYKIIGADQKEYGPVTADQIRQWIMEGRLNAQSQIMAEGATEWKPLNAFPEFASALAAKAPPPPPGGGPAGPAVDPEAFAQQILARGYSIQIGDSISKGWELVKSDFWPIVLATFLIFIIQGAVGGVPFIGGIIALFFTGVLNGGLYYYFLKKIRGESPTIGDAFAGFSIAFVQLMLGGLVSQLLIGVGILLCIIPGIYLAVAWSFALPLIIDKKLDFWPAMELSRKVLTRNWWSMFGFVIVLGLLNILGVLACCVGVFITMSIMMGALAHTYEDIFGSRSPANSAAPAA